MGEKGKKDYSSGETYGLDGMENEEKIIPVRSIYGEKLNHVMYGTRTEISADIVRERFWSCGGRSQVFCADLGQRECVGLEDTFWMCLLVNTGYLSYLASTACSQRK